MDSSRPLTALREERHYWRRCSCMSEGLRNSAEAEVEAAGSLILAMYRRNRPERVVSKYKPDKRCRVPSQHFDSRVFLHKLQPDSDLRPQACEHAPALRPYVDRGFIDGRLSRQIVRCSLPNAACLTVTARMPSQSDLCSDRIGSATTRRYCPHDPNLRDLSA